MKLLLPVLILICLGTGNSSCTKKTSEENGTGRPLTINYARVGLQSILNDETVAPEGKIIIGFSHAVSESVRPNTFQLFEGNREVGITATWLKDRTEVELGKNEDWIEGKYYTLVVDNSLKGKTGETFKGANLSFSIYIGELQLKLIEGRDRQLSPESRNDEIPLNPSFDLILSHPVSIETLRKNITTTSSSLPQIEIEKLSDSSFRITTGVKLNYYKLYQLAFKQELGSDAGRPFTPVNFKLFTTLDSTYKFPQISDEQLLTLIQEKTFGYFWQEGHPVSGMAKERLSSGNTVTTGGTGFGLMAMIAATERNFITRDQALERWEKIISFLETADRFHGAWPHWLNGETGKVQNFSEKNNGADLVETAFLIQGLLTVREYLNTAITKEKNLGDRISALWEGVEWDWFTQNGKKVLYWHWSPNFEWAINLPIRGHNETQIVYILAAASPTHPIGRDVYEEGYARSGAMLNGKQFYGYTLPAGPDAGGPLFFAHYSYLGLDPRKLQDKYVNYWQQNVAHAMINRAYCTANPARFAGYSENCWGLTASDGPKEYSAHSPTNDRGVIAPTAAISSLPYSPDESMAAIRHFYYLLGDRIWGKYGFYDAFSITDEWVDNTYLAIDQGPIICMIENYRTGLLWNLFMKAPEIKNGLDKLNFQYE